MPHVTYIFHLSIFTLHYPPAYLDNSKPNLGGHEERNYVATKIIELSSTKSGKTVELWGVSYFFGVLWFLFNSELTSPQKD